MANQLRYILKRIVYSFITILVLTSVTFLLMQLLPGDPFTGGKDIPDTVMAALEAKYGLDKPVPQQLIMYIGNALHGDFGISIPDGRAVTDIIKEAFRFPLIWVSGPCSLHLSWVSSWVSLQRLKEELPGTAALCSWHW